jgi:hypothetical protein
LHQLCTWQTREDDPPQPPQTLASHDPESARTDWIHFRWVAGFTWSGILASLVPESPQLILAVDHPLVSGGRVACLLIDDADLAERLAAGFDGLWAKVLEDLREVRAVPIAFRSTVGRAGLTSKRMCQIHA